MAITAGTAVTKFQTPAATSSVSGATFSAAVNDVILCGVVTDENSSGTTVNSIVVSGSPTYSTAWARVPTNGRVIVAGFLLVELWYAVTSSTITSQTVTVTISSSEKFGFVCVPYSGCDTANPIPNSANTSTTAAVGTLTTASISYNGSGNSKYVGWLGVGSDNNTNVAPNASFTQTGVINDAAGSTLWVHGEFETLTTAVTSAQTVNATWSPSLGAGLEAAALIGVELKEAGAGGGATSHLLSMMGSGT